MSFFSLLKYFPNQFIFGLLAQDETVAVAQRFRKFCIDRIEMMQTCVACCENALMHPSEYASMVCETGHSVLWTRFTDSLFWPSKLMTIDGSKAKVWIFGRHVLAEVSHTDCLLYSHERPNEIAVETNELSNALQVRLRSLKINLFKNN